MKKRDVWPRFEPKLFGEGGCRNQHTLNFAQLMVVEVFIQLKINFSQRFFSLVRLKSES